MKDFLANSILEDVSSITEKINFSEISGRTILITGASGLIGHYLIAAIKKASESGHMPTILFLSAKNPLPDYFDSLVDGLPTKFLSGDLADDNYLSSLPNADYIIHGAGYGQPGKFLVDPVKTLKINTVATFKLFEKLNTGGKMLFISSSEVYSGLPAPYREEQIGTTNTNHPRSCYIEGKRGGEAAVNAFRHEGINAKSARLSLAYGPGTKKNDARVLNNFIQKALLDGQINLLDMGESQRTYVYVTDAVEILFAILFFGQSDIYNVGGTSQTTIGNLAKAIGKHLNVPVHFPKDSKLGLQGAPENVYLEMNKVALEFSKKEFVQLEQGLQKTVEWQKELYLNQK